MPAHLGRRGERAGRAQRVGRVADRGEPRLSGPAAEHRGGHHQDGTVAGGVEGEAAERDRAGAGHGDLVLDRGPVEQFPQPLLAGREPVLARWQRDPRRLAPADQPLAVADPGQRGGSGKPAYQAVGVGDGDRAHRQPVRYRLALVTTAGFHACQLYVASGATQVPGTCLVTAPPRVWRQPGSDGRRCARVARSNSYKHDRNRRMNLSGTRPAVSDACLRGLVLDLAASPQHWLHLVRYDPARRWYQRLLGEEDREGRLRPAAAFEAVRGGALLVDIRPQAQRAAEGIVPGALHVERNVLEWRLDPGSETRLPQATGYDQHVIVMCSQGYASSLAAASL